MAYIEEQDYSEHSKKIDLNIWKRLVSYALRSKKLVVTIIVTLLIVGLFDIAYPLLSRYVIDNYVKFKMLDGFGRFIAVYMAMVVLQGLGVYAFVSRAGKLEMSISYDIRQDAFKRLQELSFSFFDKTAVGYLMARMVSDVARLSDMIAWSIVDLMWGSVYMIGVIITMFVLSWKLALMVLVVIPPLAVICIIFQRLILKYQRRVRKTNSRITGAFNEGIMGAMTSKTLVRESENAKEFDELTGKMKKASIRAALLSALFMPIVYMLGSIGSGIALFEGGRQVMLFGLSFGTITAFISYTANFFEPVQQIAAILAEMQSAQASAERVISLIDTNPDVIDSAEVMQKYGDVFEPVRDNWEDIKGDIDFEHVSFSYVDGESVLDDFNLHVNAGETIALVGETGAGKSTIVNLVCRFYEPTSGRILIDGVDYRERGLLWLQDRLGYVLQTPHLFSGTIADNIRYGKKDATDDEIRRASELVRADKFILKQEKGYDTEVGEGGARLSTGEKQLISFARVMLKDPSVFVLDEATSSIDTETEQLLQDAISAVMHERTGFVVAHRLSTIRSADRILVIRGGKVTESGTHSELLRLKGYYYDLYTTQFTEEASKKVLS